MKTTMTRATLLWAGLWTVAPDTLSAHEGHAWLTGAAQPTLGLDHFLAALFLVVAVTIGIISATRRSRGDARDIR